MPVDMSDSDGDEALVSSDTCDMSPCPLKARNGPGEGPSRSDWPRPHRVLQAIGQWHKAARGHEELGWLEKDGKSAKSSGSIDVMLKVR